MQRRIALTIFGPAQRHTHTLPIRADSPSLLLPLPRYQMIECMNRNKRRHDQDDEQDGEARAWSEEVKKTEFII